MDIIYVMMLVFMTGFFCVLSFLVGCLSVLSKKRVNLNPIEVYKEHKIQKEQSEAYDLEQRQLATMFRNIDRYDGSPLGQEDIPIE